MALTLPPRKFKELFELVGKFNNVPEDDPVHQIFLLQKIIYMVNKTKYDADLYKWVNDSELFSLSANLKLYSVDPCHDFYLKGIHFAKAVTEYSGESVVVEAKEASQDRFNALLKENMDLLNNSFESSREKYIANSLKISAIIQANSNIRDLIENHTRVLNLAYPKIRAIKNEPVPKQSKKQIPTFFNTEPLGKQVNNQNYKLQINDEEYIFRIEDRSELGLEQTLHFLPISKYFVKEFAVFMMVFNHENKIEYRPVVLSQLANQGSLRDVAQNLRIKNRIRDVAPQTAHYFEQLADFCAQLIESKVYHPDIKLTNFLAHNNRVLISDRKTLITEENPRVLQVRSSPLYAPEEYKKCINPQGDGFNYLAAFRTKVTMPEFMAYQLGMALREFLILSQFEKLPDEFLNPSRSPASFFTKPSPAIINLSLLSQELMREDPTKRLSITQFKNLLKYRNEPVELFYSRIEKEIPTATLGVDIDADVNEINALLVSPYNGKDLLDKANIIFDKVTNRDTQETRIVRLAEKLADKTFKECSVPFFKKVSKSIESALLNEDWKKAPWHRKFLHLITFTSYRVDRVTSPAHIRLKKIEIDTSEFQRYMPQLSFIRNEAISKLLGTTESVNFADFLMSHQDKIYPNSASNSLSSQAPSNSQTQSFASNTLLIDSNSAASNKKTATLQAQTIFMNTSSAPNNNSSNVNTTVINTNNTTNSAGTSSMIVKDTPVVTMEVKSIPENKAHVEKTDTEANTFKNNTNINGNTPKTSTNSPQLIKNKLLQVPGNPKVSPLKQISPNANALVNNPNSIKTTINTGNTPEVGEKKAQQANCFFIKTRKNRVHVNKVFKSDTIEKDASQKRINS